MRPTLEQLTAIYANCVANDGELITWSLLLADEPDLVVD
jgi:hypothetical protein